MTEPLSAAADTPSPAQEALDAFATRFGFRKAKAGQAYMDDPAKLASVISDSQATIDALAQILAASAGLDIQAARKLCGLHGRLDLIMLPPGEMPGDAGACFQPANCLVKVCGEPTEDRGAAGHFGHEWAHALDMMLGGGIGAPPKAVGSTAQLYEQVAHELANSPSPYQSALGAMARAKLAMPSHLTGYASVEIAGLSDGSAAGAAAPQLRAFARLVGSLLPERARRLGRSERALRISEASAQSAKLSEMIQSAALECLAKEPEIAKAATPAQISQLARFCAKAVASASVKEGARRKGREVAIDAAKADIRSMLRMSMRLAEDSSERIASAIFHIAPIKEMFDPYYAAPYTGRSGWETPASLADLSCALIRVSRNQRALENSKLAKERFVPMAFWWSMRRQVSIDARAIERAAGAMFENLTAMGKSPSSALEHAKQWRAERGEYKAGAAVFSDLIATGSKMIRAEADMAGRSIDGKEALSLRRKITAPFNAMARRATVSEAFAESFEQFVISQARSKSALGRACKRALEGPLVDPDPEERAAALDPAQSWMNNKDGDAEGNAKRWRALLRDIPSLIGPHAQAIDNAKSMKM